MTFSVLLAHGGGGGLHLELPPLHPILVNFTAAVVPVSFVSDLLARLLRRDTLRAAGWWTLVYAVVITPLTAAAGWYWARDMEDMSPRLMSFHRWLGTTIVVLLALLVLWRSRFVRRDAFPSIFYLLASAALVIGLIAQGHAGGRMSFGHGGSPDEPPSAAPTTTAPTHVHTHSNADAGKDGSAPATTQESETQPLKWRDSIRIGG
jgi:uncharacterized membrane protein